jgi:D-erythrulose 4-kinase
MTTLHHDATTFADRALDGFVAANPDIDRVDGGIVSTAPRPDGTVAVVIGGGSGHYPAFAGLVGPGLATGVAYGNIFASPSAGQIRRVALAAQTGGGVLLSYGNYAGDVLHFGQAAERLRAEGVDVRVLPVTDDIASGSPEESAKRRGIAGDLIVFKVAGAAAAAGYDLDAVEAVARRANDRTRSLGVAFSGCTLPGADEPLFSVPEGMMSVGLGIHGEPGISEQPLPTPDELADLLVDRLLADVPADRGGRAVLLLNGLGTFKYEELFVLYGLVASRVAAAGVEIVAPAVGELVTSLDMNGLSLTMFWLDAELEELWTAPASSPAFRTGSVPTTDGLEARHASATTVASAAADARHPELVPGAVDVLDAIREVILAGEEEFGRIDAIAGDGDHGIGMARGVTGAVEAAATTASRPGVGIATLLADAGEGWSEHAGGTSGALWGVTLTAVGGSLAGCDALDAASIAAAARAGLDAVVRLGGAQPGDKTLVDAFTPYVETLEQAATDGADLLAACDRAADAAQDAADATAQLRPRLGRARPLAEKSFGHPDAGAVSFARIVRAVHDRLAERATVTTN